MAFDYSEIIEVAKELIEEFGREVTLIREAQAAADPNKPWEGPADGGETEVTLYSVVVPPNQVRIFGLSALGQATEFVDLMAMSEYIHIIFPGTHDVRKFTHVDDGERFSITGAQVLKPGNDQLLAYLGVRR